MTLCHATARCMTHPPFVMHRQSGGPSLYKRYTLLANDNSYLITDNSYLIFVFVGLLSLLLLLLSLRFPLGPRPPERVVDSGVFEQGGEDEDETHDEVDVDRLDVRDARECRSDTRADRRHRQHRRYTCVTVTTNITIV